MRRSRLHLARSKRLQSRRRAPRKLDAARVFALAERSERVGTAADCLPDRGCRAFPDARVVKSLNTVNADVMIDPGIVPGSHTMFVRCP